MVFRASNPTSSSRVQAETSVAEAETIFTMPPKKNRPGAISGAELIRQAEIEAEIRIRRQRELREAAALANPPTTTSPAKQEQGRPPKR
jgi:hypothetical protein